MNFFSRLLDWPSKRSVKDLEAEIARNEESIEAAKPIVEEASRRTSSSAEDLRRTVKRSRRRSEVGRRLIEDIVSGMPDGRRHE